MKALIRQYHLSIICFFIVFGLLTIVHLKTNNQIIIIERFLPGAAWIEIVLIAIYAGLLIRKMKDPKNVPAWRQRSWLLFTVVFFGQLLLGLIGFEKFLMTGTLHLPVPAMILSGPVFRGEISFMTILFLSTIILSGPTWCSHLCYFGAIDGAIAQGKTKKHKIKHKYSYKYSILVIVIGTTILLRLLSVNTFYAAIFGAAFGLIGFLVIVFLSRKRKKMIHCTVYCPIGTLVNYLKYINPFRLRINDTCTMCAHCIPPPASMMHYQFMI